MRGKSLCETPQGIARGRQRTSRPVTKPAFARPVHRGSLLARGKRSIFLKQLVYQPTFMYENRFVLVSFLNTNMFVCAIFGKNERRK